MDFLGPPRPPAPTPPPPRPRHSPPPLHRRPAYHTSPIHLLLSSFRTILAAPSLTFYIHFHLVSRPPICPSSPPHPSLLFLLLLLVSLIHDRIELPGRSQRRRSNQRLRRPHTFFSWERGNDSGMRFQSRSNYIVQFKPSSS